MTCPLCRQRLLRRREHPFDLWVCAACDGRAATVATLRRGIRHDYLHDAWQRAIGAAPSAGRRCPGCSAATDLVPTAGPEIDVCRRCQLMWFDAGELDALPVRDADGLAAEQWQDELRRMQRRREDSEFYARILSRRSFVGPF